MDFFLSDPNNLFILAAAVVSGLMLLWPALTRARGGAAISATQAVQLVNQRQAVIVDVRDAQQYAAAHIAQARNVPLAEIEQKASSLPKNKPLVVVCDHGRDSAKAAAKLKQLGHAEVFTLEGGLRGWVQGGLPLAGKKA